jgi:hypothetical protein
VTVLRYFARNSMRAELVSRAEDWNWSSLPSWQRGDPWLRRGAVPVRDEKWLERVSEHLSVGDLRRLRHSVSPGPPVWRRDVDPGDTYSVRAGVVLATPRAATETGTVKALCPPFSKRVSACPVA